MAGFFYLYPFLLQSSTFYLQPTGVAEHHWLPIVGNTIMIK